MASFYEDCPSCRTTLQLQIDCEVGDAVECDHCQKELHVIWSDPFTLAETSRDEEYIPDCYYPYAG